MTRSPAEIIVERDALGMPAVGRPGPHMLDERRAWRLANPVASARYDALNAELDAIYAADTTRRARERHGAQLAHVFGEAEMAVIRAPKPTEAMTVTKEWLLSGRKWLVLGGKTGNGKTYAAAWCVEMAPSQGHSARFIRFNELSRVSAFGAGANELDALRQVGLLVIDDWPTEPPAAWARQLAGELADARHQAGRRTIITANFAGREEAIRCLGERISDRIRESGTVVWLSGASMRRQEK